MGPILTGLTKLQSVENRLRAVKSKLKRSRRGVVFQENQVRNLQNDLEAKKEEIKLTKVQSDRLEMELRQRDDDIQKYRSALNLAKSNREYSAILTELNTSKADNAKIENQVLELMKNIETDEAQCEQIKAQIEEQKKKLEEVRKLAAEKSEKFDKEIADIQNEWDQTASSIPRETLDQFKRVADTYDGEAIAFIEQPDEKLSQYNCGGCFMGLTTETVNRLMSNDEVLHCPNCSRILILKDSEES